MARFIKRKFIGVILTLAMLVSLMPEITLTAQAADELTVSLGTATLKGSSYYFTNAKVSGSSIKTILICFTSNVSSGDKITLPSSSGDFSAFTVSNTSASNNYSKRINISSGATSSVVEDYIQAAGFTTASSSQNVRVTLSNQLIEYDTFYSIDTQHYYQYISYATDASRKTWIQAYDLAKASTFMGISGYLATVTNLKEDKFINSLSGKETGWLGGTRLKNDGTIDGNYYNGTFSNGVITYDKDDTKKENPIYYGETETYWHWACGPEIGTKFYPDANVNTYYNSTDLLKSHNDDLVIEGYGYFNWAVSSLEPNNYNYDSAYVTGEDWEYEEACLTTLAGSRKGYQEYIGKDISGYTWNDICFNKTKVNTNSSGDEYYAMGYFVEYGDSLTGGIGGNVADYSVSDSVIGASVYSAMVNVLKDDSAYDPTGSVELKSGDNTYQMTKSGTGVYTATLPAATTTYYIYIDDADTGVNITVSGSGCSATVNYYTISWDTDGNGSVDDTTTDSYGSTPSHADGSKAADAQYTYTFTGWSPAISAVTGAVTYTAQFSTTTNTYAPTAAADTATATEDTAATIKCSDLLANDTDVDGDPLTVTGVSDPAYGAAVLNADGTITYTPDPNYNGTDTFTYTVSDGNGGTDNATVTVTIGAVNDVPTAGGDTAAINENGVKISVLANDTDVDGDPLTVTAVSNPAHGTVTINGDGTVTYTPAGYYGTDTFTYTVSDGNGGTDNATVSVAVNSLPIAVNDSDNTSVGIAKNILVSTLLANDSDPEGDPVTLNSFDAVSAKGGTISLSADGTTLTFTPTAYSTIDDSFTYTISDGRGGEATATVNIKMGVKYTIDIVPNPASIVANGTSKTLLTATVKDETGVGVAGVLVVFSTSAYNSSANFPDGTTALTDANGVATIYYQSTNLESVTTDPSIFAPISFDVFACADDAALGLHARDSFKITFTQGTLTGVLYDDSTENGYLANTQITISVNNNGRVWSSTLTTDANGAYSTYVPWSCETYKISYDKSIVTVDGDGEEVTTNMTFSQTGTTDATNGGEGGVYDSEKTITGLVLQKDESDNSTHLLDNASSYKVSLYDASGNIVSFSVAGASVTSTTLDSNGQYTMEGLGKGTYTVAVTYETLASDGVTSLTLISGTRTVMIGSDGQMTISEVLIDPYGTITDNDTGAAINDVNVTLYYADTARNRANGIVPNTVVSLPAVAGFAPNNNINPDTDADGSYAFMVYQTKDYYIVATAAGYQTYTSPTLSVEYTILRHNIVMTKLSSVSSGWSTNTDTEKTDLAVAIQASTMKVIEGDTVTMTVTYANKMTSSADKVTVQVDIPSTMSIISIENGGVISNSSIVWSLGSLAGGETGKLTFTLKAGDISGAQEYSTATAAITSDSANHINLEDDASFVKLLIYAADSKNEHTRYIKGYPDGEVKPDGVITRAEVAAIFARLLDLEGTVTHQTEYSDVESDFWAVDYIEAVTAQGIFTGYDDGTFKPNQAITRAELATVIARYLGIVREDNLDQYISLSGFTDTQGSWAAQTIEELFRYCVVTGYEDGTFKPNQSITRAEAITMINRMLYRGPLTNVEPSFPDNGANQWYFGDIEEATRTHYYILNADGTETMTEYIQEKLW